MQPQRLPEATPSSAPTLRPKRTEQPTCDLLQRVLECALGGSAEQLVIRTTEGTDGVNTAVGATAPLAKRAKTAAPVKREARPETFSVATQLARTHQRIIQRIHLVESMLTAMERPAEAASNSPEGTARQDPSSSEQPTSHENTAAAGQTQLLLGMTGFELRPGHTKETTASLIMSVPPIFSAAGAPACHAPLSLTVSTLLSPAGDTNQWAWLLQLRTRSDSKDTMFMGWSLAGGSAGGKTADGATTPMRIYGGQGGTFCLSNRKPKEDSMAPRKGYVEIWGASDPMREAEVQSALAMGAGNQEDEAVVYEPAGQPKRRWIIAAATAALPSALRLVMQLATRGFGLGTRKGRGEEKTGDGRVVRESELAEGAVDHFQSTATTLLAAVESSAQQHAAAGESQGLAQLVALTSGVPVERASLMVEQLHSAYDDEARRLIRERFVDVAPVAQPDAAHTSAAAGPSSSSAPAHADAAATLVGAVLPQQEESEMEGWIDELSPAEIRELLGSN